MTKVLQLAADADFFIWVMRGALPFNHPGLYGKSIIEILNAIEVKCSI